VADTIERFYLARAYDGLNVSFRVTEDLDTFIERVVPLLQAKGIFRTEYESSTLRGNLGLPIPENRYTKARREAAEAEAAETSFSSTENAVTDPASESVNA
jgi:hypothetical protein